MAYLLLAIGALMSVAGAYAIVTGSHIVQVEEGWTSVIAGTTMFVGGFVTMALGLVLRALGQIQHVLNVQPVAAPLPEILAATVPAADAVVDVPHVAEPEPRIGKWRRTKELVPERIAPTPPPPLPRLADKVMPPEAEPAPVPVSPAFSPEPLTLDAGEPVFETPDPVDDYKLETPSTAEHDLPEHPPEVRVAEVVSPPPKPPASLPRIATAPALPPSSLAPAPPPPPHPAPAMDDWLDRAFAEFDQDLPKSHDPSKNQDLPQSQDLLNLPKIEELSKTEDLPKTEELPKSDTARALSSGALFKTSSKSEPVAPPPNPEPELEPAYADIEPRETQAEEPAAPGPPPLSSLAPPPLASAPTAAVIGRYEADGTSYVMYADGSIEAHSDAGVYRFASMAELKAFIES